MDGTPPGRDRYADLVRATSILMVVLGHWLQLAADHLGPLVPYTAWITWIFQVIPIFFFVGGYLNASSWERAVERAVPWSEWIRRRAQRLFVPLGPLLAFWIALVPVLLALGVPSGFVHVAAHAAFVPIWFLGVYLGILALTPWTLRAHRQLGWWAMPLYLAGALAVDAFVRAGVPLAWTLNGFFVWAGIHQLGYLWRDGAVPRQPLVGVAMALAGAAGLFALVGLGYPVSMVALGDEGNNVNPPSAAMLVLGIGQLGGVLAARRAVGAVLARRRVWIAVGAVGSVTLTVFLWHMTAILLAAAIAWSVGAWPQIPDIRASAWIVSPWWILVMLAILAVLVAVFVRYERAPTRPSRRASTPRALAGLVATLLGVLWLEGHGVYPPEVDLVAIAAGIALLAGGLALLGALRVLPHARRAGSSDGR